MKTDKEIIEEIERIEEQLKALRISIAEKGEARNLEAKAKPDPTFKIGDRVQVKNPNFGQESVGKVVKTNPKSGFVTIAGKRFGRRIRRLEKNLKKLD